MPKLKEVTISYHAKMKASLPANRFENAEVSELEVRTYDVSDLKTEEEVLEFTADERAAMIARIAPRVVQGYFDIKDGNLGGDDDDNGD